MSKSEQNELKQAQEYLSYWQSQMRLDHIDFDIFLMAPGASTGSGVRGYAHTKTLNRED